MKMKGKIIIDILLLGFLLPSMLYPVFDWTVHEILGTCLLAVFIAHTLINTGWYKRLFRGTYSFRRTLVTVINIATLIAFLCLGYSGIVLSGYVFAFLDIQTGKGFAHSLHLAASYWCFIFMGLHLGMHWEMLLGMMKRAITGSKAAANTAAVPGREFAADNAAAVSSGLAGRIGVGLISLYGAYAFISEKILDNLLLINHFAFFNYEQSGWEMLAKYGAMFVLFAAIGHYGLKPQAQKGRSSHCIGGAVENDC